MSPVWDITICSFALHLVPSAGELFNLLYELSSKTEWLIVIAPHKKPEVSSAGCERATADGRSRMGGDGSDGTFRLGQRQPMLMSFRATKRVLRSWSEKSEQCALRMLTRLGLGCGFTAASTWASNITLTGFGFTHPTYASGVCTGS